MNQRPDLVPEHLRAVEREVDTYHRNNPLTQLPFAEASWYFLAFCEEVVMRAIIRTLSGEDQPSTRDLSIMADNVIQHAKWPLRWLRDTCPTGGSIPSRYNDATYKASWELSDLSLDYLAFESAFTFASWGGVTLGLDGRTITVSDELSADPCFEAYDRLSRPPGVSDVGAAGEAFFDRVGRSVRVRGDWFAYDLNPRLVAEGLDALAPVIDPKFPLPGAWQFPQFSLAEFACVGRVLCVLAYIHFHTRMVAAQQGCPARGYARALLLMRKDELFRRCLRYTGVTEAPLKAIIETMTYGSRDVKNPDPALQPIIRLSPSVYAIAPNVVMNSALERNLLVLLNRLPDAKSAYTTLSRQKEALSRNTLIEGVIPLNWRYWHGSVSGWGGASEIDLAVISEAERCCLILELKSFIEPAEPREIHERSQEIAHGIQQIRDRRAMMASTPDALLQALGIDDQYRIAWTVASDTSVGAAYVQAADVPVVRTSHLLAKLAREQNLGRCFEWLSAGDYLPVEGVHYEVINDERKIGGWGIEWYGLKYLVEDYL